MLGGDKLSDADVEPLKIRYYIDGYHGYLTAQHVVALHRTFLEDVLANFTRPENLCQLFDFEPSADKQAALVADLLTQADQDILESAEAYLRRGGVDVIDRKTADLFSNPLFKDVSGKFRNFSSRGRSVVKINRTGVVFAPSLNKDKLLRNLAAWRARETNCRWPDKNLVARLDKVRTRLEQGDFQASQKFYKSLADELGTLSDRGQLKISWSRGRRIIEEKGVDGDLIATLISDALQDHADVFVLLANDTDFAPAVDRILEVGKRVVLLSHADRPSAELHRVVGRHGILHLLSNEREFDFSPIWLKKQDARSLQALEDIRMQWSWWKAHGLTDR